MVMAEIALLSAGFLRLIRSCDPDHGLKTGRKVCLAVLLLSAVWGGLLGRMEDPPAAKALYGLLAACLAVSSITDYQTKNVYDFLPVLAALGGAVLVAMNRPGRGVLLELLVFLALQFLLFSRMYGTGDCLVFAACAVYLAAGGRGLLACLLHMGTVFLALGVVQALRRNLDASGNLKEPAALVPYISATVWFFL